MCYSCFVIWGGFIRRWIMSGCVCFFFFKQKTAYEILTCDWSSDVCSSDLATRNWQYKKMGAAAARNGQYKKRGAAATRNGQYKKRGAEIGRASYRERV